MYLHTKFPEDMFVEILQISSNMNGNKKKGLPKNKKGLC